MFHLLEWPPSVVLWLLAAFVGVPLLVGRAMAEGLDK